MVAGRKSASKISGHGPRVGWTLERGVDWDGDLLEFCQFSSCGLVQNGGEVSQDSKRAEVLVSDLDQRYGDVIIRPARCRTIIDEHPERLSEGFLAFIAALLVFSLAGWRGDYR